MSCMFYSTVGSDSLSEIPKKKDVSERVSKSKLKTRARIMDSSFEDSFDDDEINWSVQHTSISHHKKKAAAADEFDVGW